MAAADERRDARSLAVFLRKASQRGQRMVSDTGTQIVTTARELGAAAAGIASLAALERSPSHEMLARFGTKIDGEYSYEGHGDLRAVTWPADALSAVVIAVPHPQGEPELDWSCPSGSTLGAQLLTAVSQGLSDWSARELGVTARRMPYWVEEGGAYVKDAAVLAGLGCIGRNNLLVNPQLGPRLRLQVMLVDDELTPTGPVEYDPCRDCDDRCRRACPQGAFEKLVLSPAAAGLDDLPGRDGAFSRARCFVQMEQDLDDSGVEVDGWFMSDRRPSPAAADDFTTAGRIKWCRRCEFACPVGR
jgi:epoxyqueuosine reductase